MSRDVKDLTLFSTTKRDYVELLKYAKVLPEWITMDFILTNFVKQALGNWEEKYPDMPYDHCEYVSE